jgi:uncharacterized phage protein (TIGR01671 family)
MREIKFRAWDKKNNVWLSLTNLKMSLKFGSIWEYSSYDVKKNPNIEINQYTGLKDKHGKKIYEGDIIQYRLPKRYFQEHFDPYLKELMEPYIKTYTDVVIFKDGRFALKHASYDLDCICNDTYTHDDLIDCFQMRNEKEWHDPKYIEESNLLYILDEYKLSDENELIEYLSGCEVIGNIYENPELLEVK